MSKEAMKLALEALEKVVRFESDSWELGSCRVAGQAIKALREALASEAKEQPAQPDNTCNNALRIQGKGYPRTCKKCGLGPCVELAQQALDKMAENARELGLDYEPSAGTQVSKVWWDGEKLMAKPIPLEDFYEPAQQEPVAWMTKTGSVWKTKADETDQPLYTSPPAQRTWVGLTDEEILQTLDLVAYDTQAFDFAYRIEAKLKEKNNG